MQIYSWMMNLKHEGKLRQKKREKGREGDLVIQVSSSFSKRNKKIKVGHWALYLVLRLATCLFKIAFEVDVSLK